MPETVSLPIAELGLRIFTRGSFAVNSRSARAAMFGPGKIAPPT
jgi:hypothetical protein